MLGRQYVRQDDQLNCNLCQTQCERHYRSVIVFQVRQRDTDIKVMSPSIIEEAHTMDNVSRL